MASRYGNRGQVSYGLANSALDQMLHAEAALRGTDCLVRSLSWGPWEGGMMRPDLVAAFRARGIAVIGMEQGAAQFVRELSVEAGGDTEVILVPEGGFGLAAPIEECRWSVDMTPETFGVLRGHVIDGRVVLPIAMALELFASAIHGCMPETTLVGFEELKVLRGVVLDHFEEGEDRLAVVLRPEGEDLVCELRDAHDVVRYRARAVFGAGAASPTDLGPAPDEPWHGPIYDGVVLFHTGAFQVIDSVDGISPSAVTGQMRGAAGEPDWDHRRWQLDPAAVDGALQFSCLLTAHRLGGVPLPTQIDALYVHRHDVRGPLAVQARVRSASDLHAVQDVVVRDADGADVFEIRGMTTHCRTPRA